MAARRRNQSPEEPQPQELPPEVVAEPEPELENQPEILPEREVNEITQ